MRLTPGFLAGQKRGVDYSGNEEAGKGRKTKSFRYECDSASKIKITSRVQSSSLPSHHIVENNSEQIYASEANGNSLPIYICTMEQTKPGEDSATNSTRINPVHAAATDEEGPHTETAATSNGDLSSSEDSMSSSFSCYDSESARSSPSPERVTSRPNFPEYESPSTSNKEIEPHIEASNKDQTLEQLDPRQFPTDMSPDSYVVKMFHCMLNFKPFARPTLELSPLSYNATKDPFIAPISDEDLANYSVEVVTATRDEDLETLKDLHAKGRSLSCCNRYGESLMHMACRRGFFEIVDFLKHEANVAIRITDDCGRTPLHDAFWHRECQYGIVDLLVRIDPSLLLLRDKRGHTPFAYARREHWEVWKQFMWDRREHLMQAMDMDVMQLFRLNI